MTDYKDLIAEARSRERGWFATGSTPSQVQGREYRRLMIALADALESLTPTSEDAPHSPDEDAILAAEHPSDCSTCGHRSDCALHNRPAMQTGTCDCDSSVRPEMFPGTMASLDGLTIRKSVD